MGITICNKCEKDEEIENTGSPASEGWAEVDSLGTVSSLAGGLELGIADLPGALPRRKLRPDPPPASGCGADLPDPGGANPGFRHEGRVDGPDDQDS
jgi:hypothetical protein